MRTSRTLISLSAALVAVLGLVTAPAAASALPSHDVLGARAVTKKPYMAPCQTDDECATNNCECYSPSAETLCLRYEPGGPCERGDQCGSGVCRDDKTCAQSTLHGPCDSFLDCPSKFNYSPYVCVQHECVINNGESCRADEDCLSGYCATGICRRRAQSPDAACDIDAECKTGKCVAVAENVNCVDNKGNTTPACATSEKVCARYALGHACANNDECARGLCKAGLCKAGKRGDACSQDPQCTEQDAICLASNKCGVPANSTLYPLEHCSRDAQCYSGKCLSSPAGVNVFDSPVPSVPFPNDPPQLKACDYIALGKGKCRAPAGRAYLDCAVGLCIGSKCVQAADGTDCLLNQHCKGLCGTDGKCFMPRTALASGAPCKTGKQCKSGQCVTGTIGRPFPPNEPDERQARASVQLHDYEDTVCK